MKLLIEAQDEQIRNLVSFYKSVNKVIDVNKIKSFLEIEPASSIGYICADISEDQYLSFYRKNYGTNEVWLKWAYGLTKHIKEQQRRPKEDYPFSFINTEYPDTVPNQNRQLILNEIKSESLIKRNNTISNSPQESIKFMNPKEIIFLSFFKRYTTGKRFPENIEIVTYLSAIDIENNLMRMHTNYNGQLHIGADDIKAKEITYSKFGIRKINFPEYPPSSLLQKSNNTLEKVK